MIVLDTHIWHWWVNSIPEKLPGQRVLGTHFTVAAIPVGETGSSVAKLSRRRSLPEN